ncbi:MAG: PaaI family thioesterase [Chloroflexota bacterium]
MTKQPNSHDCFICGMRNVAGVQVAFYEEPKEDGPTDVVARFTARQMHQGYPGRLHGGVITGVLDETIGRAVNIGEGEAQPAIWGVTADFNLRFHHPVPLDVELVARGRITRERKRLFEGTGELYLPDGTVAVTATGKYFKLALDTISDTDPDALGWRVYED